MRKASLLGIGGAVLVFCGSMAKSASAKVVFTGYADMSLNPQTVSRISGPDSLLNSLGVTNRRIESRDFTINSLGLFATTVLNDQADFLMDVTYKKVGSTAGETRIQYAYVDYHPSFLELKAGRVTLPIGYYNEHYFYPFERKAITAPTYQSAIIGLPIADQGAVISKRIDIGEVGLTGAAFVVNGYGPSTTSTDTFRAGLGVTNSLTIANNVSHTNADAKFSYGGNLMSSFFKDMAKVGVSLYRGNWNASGEDYFTMKNVYGVLDIGRLNLIAEGLRTTTENDKGVVGFFGTRDWKSNGAFLEGSYSFIKSETRDLSLFAGAEETVAKGTGNGADGREKLISEKVGLAWKLNTSVILKTQFDTLDYHLPIQAGGPSQEIVLKSNAIRFNVTLTY